MRSSIGRAVLVLTAVLCGGAHAYAQGWSGGIKSGVRQGGFTGNGEFDWARKLPSTAVFANRALTDRLSAQVELVQLRSVGVSNVASPGSTLSVTADYIQLPFLLQVKLPAPAGLTPLLMAGPNFGVKLKCTLEFVGGGVRSAGDCDADRGVRSHRVDFGVTGGGGLALPLGEITIGVEARYSLGLRNFVVPLDAENSRSYGWSVLGGISVPLRRPPSLRAPRPRPIPLPMPNRGLAPLPPEPTILPSPGIQAEQPTGVPRASAMRRVTINAVDADVRSLLIGIAKETGLNIVVSSDVHARVSVTLTDAPAAEAIMAILDVAGLSVITPVTSEAPAVVFYQQPINVNRAQADVIAARFNVSAELAKWIVESRSDRPKTP